MLVADLVSDIGIRIRVSIYWHLKIKFTLIFIISLTLVNIRMYAQQLAFIFWGIFGSFYFKYRKTKLNRLIWNFKKHAKDTSL